MKVVTSSQMKEIDRIAICERGIPGDVLMENAGVAVARFVKRFVKKNRREKKVIVLAGKGNNGGDAFVVARYLLQKKYQVALFILSDRSSIKGDALIHLEKLEALVNLSDCFMPAREEIEKALKDEYSVIVDGLLGTGIWGVVQGVFLEIIHLINKSNIPIISIDIPSGLDADTGFPLGEAVCAVATVTMGLVKEGLVKNKGLDYTGKIIVADIGFPDDLLENQDSELLLITENKVKEYLPERKRISHKGDYGKILVVAGSVGLTGAATLACNAALRSGAGVVTLAIPDVLNGMLEVKLTETMTVPLPSTAAGSLGVLAKDTLYAKIKESDVLLIGPGLSRNAETAELVRDLVVQSSIPVVLDADGIYAFKGYINKLKEVAVPLIMTPHSGEFANLLEITLQELEADRLNLLNTFVKDINSIVVLKGAATLVASNTMTSCVNITGNPGMATAGCGDVLAGVIAGLLACGLCGEDAACAAVFIHGAAGDRAKKERGEISLIASDIVNALSDTFLSLAPHYRLI